MNKKAGYPKIIIFMALAIIVGAVLYFGFNNVWGNVIRGADSQQCAIDIPDHDGDKLEEDLKPDNCKCNVFNSDQEFALSSKPRLWDTSNKGIATVLNIRQISEDKHRRGNILTQYDYDQLVSLVETKSGTWKVSDIAKTYLSDDSIVEYSYSALTQSFFCPTTSTCTVKDFRNTWFILEPSTGQPKNAGCATPETLCRLERADKCAELEIARTS